LLGTFTGRKGRAKRQGEEKISFLNGRGRRKGSPLGGGEKNMLERTLIT